MRQPQLSRQPVDFIHEEDVWFAQEPFVQTPNGAQPTYPIRQTGTVPPLARLQLAETDGLLRELRVTKRLGPGLPPLSGAGLVLQLASPACRSPGRLEFRR